ncbi:MAG: GHKL domain-containing protein, partial [Flavobacteriales bacterium]|nr:GHKL domain-containing protein [Flavobacteriales bacterium]
VGALQVDERFDNFIMLARNDIFTNLGILIGLIAVIGVLMFFSVRTILARQIRVNQERAEVDTMRKELIANVSHDLRTPLASIQGYVETLLMKKNELDSERFDRYLKTTLRSTEKLRVLVDELFELSKLESKERQLIVEPLAIDDLIHDTVKSFKIEANEKGISLKAEIPKRLPQVNADIALIDRVLQNIIGNSIKFCSEGDTVVVSAIEQDKDVLISVQDTGVGIARNELPHIFERFHKGSTIKSGSGLGLAIVKNVLEMHGSIYQIESKENHGTTFTFTLPVLG